MGAGAKNTGAITERHALKKSFGPQKEPAIYGGDLQILMIILEEYTSLQDTR